MRGDIRRTLFSLIIIVRRNMGLCIYLVLRTVPTNERYFSPVCAYAGNVDVNKSY